MQLYIYGFNKDIVYQTSSCEDCILKSKVAY